MYPKEIHRTIFRKTKQDDKVIVGIRAKGDGDQMAAFDKWDAKDIGYILPWLLEAKEEMDED